MLLARRADKLAAIASEIDRSGDRDRVHRLAFGCARRVPFRELHAALARVCAGCDTAADGCSGVSSQAQGQGSGWCAFRAARRGLHHDLVGFGAEFRGRVNGPVV